MDDRSQTHGLGHIALPPPYTLHAGTGPDVLEQAVELAPEHGAGTLVCHASSGCWHLPSCWNPRKNCMRRRWHSPWAWSRWPMRLRHIVHPNARCG